MYSLIDFLTGVSNSGNTWEQPSNITDGSSNSADFELFFLRIIFVLFMILVVILLTYVIADTIRKSKAKKKE